MITHLHVQFLLPDTEPPVRREVILPDSILLEDINLIISICFGWTETNAYEFISQQTKTSFIGNNSSFFGSKHVLPADDLTLLFAFQKNKEIRYYRSTHPTDCVSIILMTTTSLLPEPTFQLNSWQGENQPCTSGCIPFQQPLVEEALLSLRENLFLMGDEFDYNQLTPLDLIAELEKNGMPPELARLFDNLSKEEAMTLLDGWISQMNEHLTTPYTMAQCLSFLSKNAMIDIMRYNHFSGYSKLRRSELEDRLLQELTNSEFLKELLKTCTIPEIELLEFLCQANMPFDTPEAALHAHHLLRSGICYLDPLDTILTVPSELRPQIQSLLQKDNLIMEFQFYDMLHTFCYTAVYLYGVYPIRQLLHRINESLQLTISEAELREVIMPMQFKRGDYILRDEWIIAAELEPSSSKEQKILDHLMRQQRQRTELFWPDMDQITAIVFNRRLADEELYRAFAKDFMRYLNSNITLALELANMEHMIRVGAPFTAVMQFLTTEVFALPDLETAEQLTEAVQHIWNQTPMWSNGGFSPNQLRARQKKNNANSSTKNNVVSLQAHRQKKNTKKKS